jgi:hypothetical protein
MGQHMRSNKKGDNENTFNNKLMIKSLRGMQMMLSIQWLGIKNGW